MTLTLTLREEPVVPLEADVLCPDRLAGARRLACLDECSAGRVGSPVQGARYRREDLAARHTPQEPPTRQGGASRVRFSTTVPS